MNRPSFLTGAVAGALTSLPLIALSYLGYQAARLPFIPFDILDWLTRNLPGNLITLGIDSLVALINTLNLGPTSSTAKLIEQIMAILMVVVGGAVLGAAVAWLMRRGRSGPQAGMAGGFVLFLLVIAVELSLALTSIGFLDTLWLIVLTVGWGMVLGWALGRRPQTAVSDDDRAARRDLLLKMAGGSAGLALGAWGLGSLLGRDQSGGATAGGATGSGAPLAEAETAVNPQATATALATSRERIMPAPGTRQEVTPEGEFYRIDINTRPVEVDGESWELGVTGLFDNPRPLTLDNLMNDYPAVTQAVTMSCISNSVGGDLISTAFWSGARMRDVLEDLGLQREAVELYIESADGFFESVSMMDLMDPRTLLVYGMNGETLPVRHGFPLRTYIPNRYGMKQPKWISRIEAISEEGPGYWVERGWSEEARPRVISVIDSVAADTAENGRVPIGGIAWAGDRGIQKVEVQVDGGEWAEAELRNPPLSPLTWIQWRYDWPMEDGRHTFRVRATDGTGALQIEERMPKRPDGATGYHEVTESI